MCWGRNKSVDFLCMLSFYLLQLSFYLLDVLRKPRENHKENTNRSHTKDKEIKEHHYKNQPNTKKESKRKRETKEL